MAQLLVIALCLALAFYAIAAVALAIPLWLPVVLFVLLPERVKANTHVRAALVTTIAVIAVPYVPTALGWVFS